MICTNCQKEDGVEWESTGLPIYQIVAVCENWLCPKCLDEAEQPVSEEASQ